MIGRKQMRAQGRSWDTRAHATLPDGTMDAPTKLERLCLGRDHCLLRFRAAISSTTSYHIHSITQALQHEGARSYSTSLLSIPEGNLAGISQEPEPLHRATYLGLLEE